jgi:hypothetical protein
MSTFFGKSSPKLRMNRDFILSNSLSLGKKLYLIGWKRVIWQS